MSDLCFSIVVLCLCKLVYHDGITIQTVYMYMLGVSFGQHIIKLHIQAVHNLITSCLLTLVGEHIIIV